MQSPFSDCILKGMARTKKRIALLMDYVFSQFQEQIHQGASSYVKESDLDVYFLGMGNYSGRVVEDEARSEVLKLICPESFDGIIMVSATFGDNPTPPKLVEELNRLKGMPMLSIGHSVIGEPHIDMDNPYGMNQVMEHLIKVHDFKHYVFVSGPLGNQDTKERLGEFKKALKNASIPFSDEYIFEGDYASSGGKKAVDFFLDRRQYKPDVFVCANDAMALGVLDGLRERGLSVPFDVALTGYDGLMLNDSLSHQFTTFDQSFYRAGYRAMKSMHQLLEEGKVIPERIRLRGNLLIGNSCGCIYPEERRKTGSDDFCQDSHFQRFKEDLEKYIAKEKDERDFKSLARSLTTTLLQLRNKGQNILQMNDFLLSCPDCITSEKELMSRLLLYHHEFCESFYYGLYENNINIQNKLIRRTNFIQAQLESQSLHSEYTIPYYEISQSLENCDFHVVGFREFNQLEVGGGLLYSTFPMETAEKWQPEKKQWFPEDNGSMVVTMICHGNRIYGYYLIAEDLPDYKFYQLISDRMNSITRNQRNLYKQQTTNRELRIQIEERKEMEIELRKTMDKLKQISIEDDLTGLHNRRGFFTLANQRIALFQREKTPFIVLYMDVDGLKNINDTHGHNQGDTAIKTAANVIKNALRESDIIARLGGDEFTALIIYKDESDVTRIKERIHRECDFFNQQKPYTWELHISIGYYCANPSENMSLDDILARADKELYRKKKKRKKNRPSD